MRVPAYWPALLGAVLIAAALTAAYPQSDAERLRIYVRDHLPANGGWAEPDCGVLRGTRAGYCMLRVTPPELDALTQGWHLVPHAARQLTTSAYVPQPHCPDWQALPNLAMYVATPPLPPMQGNTRTSFLRLWHDAKRGQVCADLEFPYG